MPFTNRLGDWIDQPAHLPGNFSWEANLMSLAFKEGMTAAARRLLVKDLWCSVFGSIEEGCLLKDQSNI